MKTLTKAFAKTAAKIEKSVQSTVHDVTGPKALQDYTLIEQVGSGGLGCLWKLWRAKPKVRMSVNVLDSEVCVWALDKKALADQRHKKGTSKISEEQLFDIFRQDAAQLLKLRHPGIVRVIEPLDESKHMMAMVTEPLFASLANVTKDFTNMNQIPEELKNLDMSNLEMKHGFLQLAESLSFLHNDAHLVHRAISPQTVFITAGGAWKLGGFGFVRSSDKVAEESDSRAAFYYPEHDVPAGGLPLQPNLDYVAPELTRSNAGVASPAADVFSLGLLAYRMFAGVSLLTCNNNLKTFTSSTMMLQSREFHGIASDLGYELRRILNLDPSARPSAIEFGGSPFFRDDTQLRALRFLDRMLERDNMQKAEFIKALGGMWNAFDGRILRYKVLPPLAVELRNETMQVVVLPMIMAIAEAQDARNFEIMILPSLLPAMQTVAGDMLLLMLKHAATIAEKVSGDVINNHLLPMMVRAYEDSDIRIQEEALKRTITVLNKIDYQSVKQAVLPRVHGLALKTASAAGKELLDGFCDVTFGPEFAVESVLPLLIPSLSASSLNPEQFSKYMGVIWDVLRKIEEKRSLNITETVRRPNDNSGIGGMMPNANGLVASKPPPTSSARQSLAWDVEDWTASSKPALPALEYRPVGDAHSSSGDQGRGSSPYRPSSSSFGQPPGGGNSFGVPSSVPQPMNAQGSGQPAHRLSSSVGGGGGIGDFQWPPSQSSIGMNAKPSPTHAGTGAVAPGITWDMYGLGKPGIIGGAGGMNSNTAAPTTSTDADDPFANWPPRTGGGGSGGATSTISGTGSSGNRMGSGSGIGSLNLGSMGLGRGGAAAMGQQTPGLGSSMQLGMQGSSGSGRGISSPGQPDQFGSLFTSGQQPQTAAPMRLQPPPNRLNPPPNRSAPQPPLLDLL
ncbi:hypothetical protein CBR_g22378 [Chara braunii]|uniref:Protein kinase domain-containing protein n=1 Tax=Chara braunii TaxID=69332 RepID=A0A388JUV3_CHABU|nr:hypothetical protein CBR_g22378 [Chara braunii]|eukprot:GBG61581.1 hypothetical protein CBR_g22378 [Chara braunii]